MNKDIKNKWVVTDPSTKQKAKQVSEYVWLYTEKGCEEVEINLKDYTLLEIAEALSPFGYAIINPSMDSFKIMQHNVVGDYSREDSIQIACECLFEYHISDYYID